MAEEIKKIKDAYDQEMRSVSVQYAGHGYMPTSEIRLRSDIVQKHKIMAIAALHDANYRKATEEQEEIKEFIENLDLVDKDLDRMDATASDAEYMRKADKSKYDKSSALKER